QLDCHAFRPDVDVDGRAGKGRSPARAATADAKHLGHLERRFAADLEDDAAADRELDRRGGRGPVGDDVDDDRVLDLGILRAAVAGPGKPVGHAPGPASATTGSSICAALAAEGLTRVASSRSHSSISRGTSVRAVSAATAQANPTIRRRARPWVMITAPLTP